MRRPVRPFVKEFKTRSANLSPAARQSRRSSPENLAVVESAPARIEASFFSSPPPSQRASNPSDAYEAAMRAADAVFGKNLPTLAPEHGSGAPTGRVLPSLVETSVFADAPIAAPADDDVKPRRGRPPGKAKKQPLVERAAAKSERFEAKATRAGAAKAALTPQSSLRLTPVPQLFDAPPAPLPVVVAFSEISPPAPSGQRERRSIQKRWVLETALKPGEKWKRRLCKAAR